MKLFILWLSLALAAFAEDSASSLAGLNLELTTAAPPTGSPGQRDFRVARLAALYVPAGEAVSPFLPAGPFSARFEAVIQSPLRAECTFAMDVAGTVRMTLNDQEILAGTSDGTKRLVSQPVKLAKGATAANRIIIHFDSPPKGDAFLRLLWLSPEFPPEPVPPTVFVRPASTPEFNHANQLRDGRLLFAQRRCTACHEAADLLPARGQGMPELAQDAPVLAEYGARFREPWLAHWVNDPHAIRPGSLMPRVFAGAGEGIDQRAADVAAFLASLGVPPEEKPLDQDLVPLGGALFANLGCIACHTTPEYGGKDEFSRVPLGHLRAKWYAPALHEYLKDPQKFYQWTRMPNFHLNDEEAAKLTAFLLSGQQKEFAAGPKGDAAKGGQLVATAGCLNCHAGVPPSTAPKLAATLEGKGERGCLATDAAARGASPDFGFTKEQREALAALRALGIDVLRRTLNQDVPAEVASRQVKNLRCQGCHTMDATASVWSQLDDETAPLAALAPPAEGEGQPIAGATAPLFTWLGEKLRPQWSADFIAGRNTVKPRPWIVARMPAFAAYADALSTGLAHDHGFSAQEPAKLPIEPAMAKVGEQLLGEVGGFNCVTCHGVGERKPTAVFEAPGLNLALSSERLRYEYYHRWVLFPQRLDPDTKMPKFADEHGKTPLTEVLDGDANKQYDAIWQYLQSHSGSK